MRDEHSPSVRRVLELPRPAWRGRMHRWMIGVAAIAGLVLTLAADGGDAAAAAAVYGVAGVGLYSVSAAAHYRIWDPARLHFLFRLDQSMIMIFILASTIPVGYAIGGSSGLLLVVGMAVGAVLGVLAIWAPFHPPRGFMNTLFFAVAWWPIFFIGSIRSGLGANGIALLLAGAAVYTVGAFIVGSQRPNPNPHVFGYHEIWHIFVIVGNALHFSLIAFIVTGNTPL